MMEKESHRALIISYFFPPLASAGSIRSLKFVKYLPNHGWTSTVLSIKPKKNDTLDYCFQSEIPNSTSVYRTKSHELFICRLISRISHDFHWFVLPDCHVGWIPSAIRAGVSLIMKENIDVIYTTSPPNSVSLIGLILKKIKHLPWVVDFRDPWTQNPAYPDYPTFFHRRFDEYLEHLVAKNADKIIFNTAPNLNDFIKKYPDIPYEKGTVITNGYDPDDFKDLKSHKTDKFTITYTGSLYGERLFLKSLRDIITESPEIKSNIKVIFAGRHPWLKYQIDEFKLQEVLEMKGPVSYKESLQLMMDSDVLLITQMAPSRSVERWYPIKLFEYLATGKPILGILPKGIARDLLQSSKSSIIVDYYDLDGIKKAIYHLYSQYNEGKLIRIKNDEVLNDFERAKLTCKLADVFDTVLNI